MKIKANWLYLHCSVMYFLRMGTFLWNKYICVLSFSIRCFVKYINLYKQVTLSMIVKVLLHSFQMTFKSSNTYIEGEPVN